MWRRRGNTEDVREQTDAICILVLISELSKTDGRVREDDSGIHRQAPDERHTVSRVCDAAREWWGEE